MQILVNINSQFLRFLKPFFSLEKKHRKISLRNEKSHDKNAISSSKNRAMSPFTFNHFPSVHLFQHEDEVSGVDPIILGKPELSTSEKVCRCISSATTKPKHCTRYANIPVAGTPFEHPCFPAKCTALCKFSWGAKGWWHATGGRLPAGGATSNQSGGRGRG